MSIIKKRKPNRSIAGDLGMYLIIVFFAIFFAIPLVYAIVNAFKPLDEIFKYPPTLVTVKNPTLDNFADLFVLVSKSWVPFSRYIFNTVFITVVGTGGHLIIASMAAYVLAKYDFPGGKWFFSAVVTALMFNAYVTRIPNFLIMTKLHWIDSYLAIIVPAFAMPMGLFLMKQFMEGVPMALIEAAKIDGAKEWRIYRQIVMPMVKPAWLTVIIFSIQTLWNDRATTYIYSEELKTLPYYLSQVVAGGTVARAGVSSAITLFLMIVPITFFVFAQSNIIETMASSGIKE